MGWLPLPQVSCNEQSRYSRVLLLNLLLKKLRLQYSDRQMLMLQESYFFLTLPLHYYNREAICRTAYCKNKNYQGQCWHCFQYMRTQCFLKTPAISNTSLSLYHYFHLLHIPFPSRNRHWLPFAQMAFSLYTHQSASLIW